MNISANRLKELSAQDLALVAKLLERIHHTNSNEPFINHLCVVLNEALPRDIFSIDSYSVNPVFFEQALSVGIDDSLYTVYRRYMHQHPLFRRLFISPESGVYTILTTTSAVKFHKTDLYHKFYRILGVEDQLAFMLRHMRGIYVIVYSRGTAFSENEKTIMDLLRPQLKIALRNWTCIRELERDRRTLGHKPVYGEPFAIPVSDSQCVLDCLTLRQRAIAEQVARGLKNREIAKELHISPKTVGKHLENIFETLDIHHRAALAAMWRKYYPVG